MFNLDHPTAHHREIIRSWIDYSLWQQKASRKVTSDDRNHDELRYDYIRNRNVSQDTPAYEGQRPASDSGLIE